MKKIIFYISILISPVYTYSQLGVGTLNPKTTLDVNGSVNVLNEIRLGGSNSGKGNAGKVGDLISGNDLNSNVWMNFDLPDGFLDGFVLSGSYILSSSTGVSFPGTSNSGTLAIAYNQGDPVGTSWKEIPNIRQTIQVAKQTNIVTISLQTLAQTSSQNGSFACGMIIDGKLEFVRLGTVSPGVGNYRILNMNATLLNLPIGQREFRFACTERNIPTGTTINIGQPISGNTMLNSEMSKTSATILVLETPQ